MSRMLKGLLLSACIMFGTGIMACCSTDSSCCSSSSSCCSTDSCCPTDCCNAQPYFSMRSQSWNAARELVGWQQFINKFEMDKIYGAFSITPEYTRSFRPCRIANYLFGPDLVGGALTITGSRKDATAQLGTGATARGANEWLADYLGLPVDFQSTVKFTPRIQNFIVDLNLYLGFDELFEGAYMRIHAPIAYTKWQLNMCETSTGTTGEYAFDAGYMASTQIERSALPTNFTDAMKGGKTWGDMQEAMKYGKIDCCSQTKTRLSDIHLTLGWNFLQDEDYHFGLFVRAGFPTGNKPTACYLFEPIVGNGGHFELGGGLTSSACLWTSDDEESSFEFYLDAHVAHLFKRKQYRSFDLKDKPNSRYMLISELSSTVANLYSWTAADTAASATVLGAQYTGNLFPLINKTTCCTEVSIAVMGEAALKFAYNWGNWSFDLGYNIWGRSGEKRCNGCSIDADKYALKGDAMMYGWVASDGVTVAANTLVPLSATQSLADIHSGRNTQSGTAYVPYTTANANHLQNRGVDNAQYANSATANANDNIMVRTALAHGATFSQQSTSNAPIYLKTSDLDTCKTPSALSHKVFANFSYAWKDDMEEDDWTGFLGLGGEAEFGSKSCDCYSALSQWGVWVKGGVAFN